MENFVVIDKITLKFPAIAGCRAPLAPGAQRGQRKNFVKLIQNSIHSSSSDCEMDSSPELRDIKTRLKSSVIISPKDGEKIYKCFFCPKIFKEMINAQRHILSRKKCLLKNEEKNVSKDDLETVIKSTPTENKMKEMKLELKRLDNNSASKNKTENKNRKESREIVCHKFVFRKTYV